MEILSRHYTHGDIACMYEIVDEVVNVWSIETFVCIILIWLKNHKPGFNFNLRSPGAQFGVGEYMLKRIFCDFRETVGD